MKLGVVSLGCDKATVDSERLVARLVGHGAIVIDEIDEADVILVNTCGFIDAAKQESIDTIFEVVGYKRTGNVKAVVAVGCLVQRYLEELKAEIPEVDLFLGFSDLGTLIPALEELGLIEPDPGAVHPGLRNYLGDGPHVRYLKISEGCDHTCAFCAIPLFRGKHKSEPMDALVVEAKELEAQGAQEINLVAQDLGHYGRDLGKGAPRLPDLLKRLLQETTVPWFRLLYVYSFGLTDELVKLISEESRIVPYIDIPIQHASDRILEAMRRPERQQTIREKVTWLREAVPDIAIRTTTIVGFPGETEDDFRILCEFIDEIEFERLGVFTYSEQDGTRAAGLADDVPDDVKLERQEELLSLQRVISEERLGRFVGRETEILIDEVLNPADNPDATHIGRVKWQADDVDGITYLRNGGWAKAGDFVRCKIVANTDCDFAAISITDANNK